MIRAALCFAALAAMIGCTPPLGPKAGGLCLNSPFAIEKADAIRQFLLDQSNEQNLFARDFSDQFRKLEKNTSLVFMRFRKGRFFSPYEIEVNINPTNGGSHLTIYGYDNHLPEGMQTVLSNLQRHFEFTTTNQDQYGNCP